MPRLISYLRMSTSEQLKGFSLERQRKTIADFAAKNDLSIEDSYSIEDWGRSSFADDAEQKQLVKFFEDLEKDKFSPGDVFALENIDRLTRRGALDALLKVNKIISKGLKLAIISDKEQKILEEIDVFTIITLSIDASRANKESAVKSQKGLANWQNKRELAATQKIAMTKRTPAWIDTEFFYIVDKETNKQIKRRKYILNEDKAEVVKIIFDLFQKGNGALKIKNYLNDNKIKQFQNCDYWEPSTISRILRNPAVFGLYQPQTQRAGKRDLIPAGEPIEDYFPAVITREIFEQCQRISESNKTRRGRKGRIFTNLFTGLLKCSKCGGGIHLINAGIDKRNKNKSLKPINYLVCKKAKFTKECEAKRIRYDDLEIAMLKAIKEINISNVLNENNPTEALIKQIRSIESDIKKKKLLVENFDKSFTENDGFLPSFMIERARETEYAIKKLEIEKRAKTNQITELNAYDSNIENKINGLNDNQDYEARAKINLLFHEIIKSISINTVKRFFVIEFKNSAKRIIDENGFIIEINNKYEDFPTLEETTTFPISLLEDPERLLEELNKLTHIE